MALCKPFWKPFILAGGISLTLLAGCDRDARSAGAQGGSGSGPSTSQRASIGDLKRQLDAVDDRLKDMEARAAGLGEDAKRALKAEMAGLEAARDRLYGQLQALQTAGSGEWEDLKTRTAHSVDSLGRLVAHAWRKSAAEGSRSAAGEDGE